MFCILLLEYLLLVKLKFNNAFFDVIQGSAFKSKLLFRFAIWWFKVLFWKERRSGKKKWLTEAFFLNDCPLLTISGIQIIIIPHCLFVHQTLKLFFFKLNKAIFWNDPGCTKGGYRHYQHDKSVLWIAWYVLLTAIL